MRYSPGGEVFCSGGADGLAVLYDGKTGEKKGILGGDKTHSGGIYAVSEGVEPSGKPDNCHVLSWQFVMYN